jgi:hypothetical protein
MTPKTELEDFFANAAENAMRIFGESGEILPMWHVVDGNDEHVLIATPWSSDEEKDITQRGLRMMFQAKHVKRLAFICEAWIATVNTMTEAKEGPRPSEHPDRREVLIINAEDRWGNVLSGNFFILRPERGPATLSPLHMNDYDAMQGRFMGMLR